MPLESCSGGSRGIEILPGPEMPEITSFDDVARIVYRGSRGIEILPGPEKHPRKRPEMLEITSFDDAARVVYPGSRGIEILPGPENCGL